MSGLDGLGWPNPNDEPKLKKTMNSQLEIKLAPTPETDRRIITQDPRMCGCGYKSEIVFADFARRLERERDEAREQRTKAVEKYQASIKEMHEVGMQRDRLLKHINVLAYWRDISECDCHNPLPNGGCLRCDLDKVFNSNQQPK